ncbi:division/cell wall cluster transcriptional repressor MraZ [Candidatus Dojkabacteria bacterium]|nr:division/cell wall cluster transcriptional repressor MraZ [Candidatus Dojkabacteria bacterium]
MLIGEYYSKIAEKNRTALPKGLRENLKGTIYLTRGYEKSLIILDQKRWNDLLKVIEVKPFLNKTVRDTKRFIAGGARMLELDLQGRFVLPENLIEFAELDKDIVFVGIIDWIEVWSIENWKAKLDDLSENSAEIAEKLIG